MLSFGLQKMWKRLISIVVSSMWTSTQLPENHGKLLTYEQWRLSQVAEPWVGGGQVLRLGIPASAETHSSFLHVSQVLNAIVATEGHGNVFCLLRTCKSFSFESGNLWECLSFLDILIYYFHSLLDNIMLICLQQALVPLTARLEICDAGSDESCASLGGPTGKNWRLTIWMAWKHNKINIKSILNQLKP